jgi:V/A-type H+-transporting ATPase subunit B
VTTMPGDDVTHPVPDNTGYITEGQFYLHDGVIDVTREDHGQIMNAMVRFYSGAREAEQKQQMSFELSEFDQKLLRFGRLFRKRFMRIEVSLPLEEALEAISCPTGASRPTGSAVPP